ncbi:MAG: hypothetical protein JEZ07_13395 [Phycisphaerae bacterium]|nr:hypothetical protein [Phycisphaerae bacterium]
MAKADVKKVRAAGSDNDVYTGLLALATGALAATLVYSIIRGNELYGQFLDFSKLFSS